MERQLVLPEECAVCSWRVDLLNRFYAPASRGFRRDKIKEELDRVEKKSGCDGKRVCLPRVEVESQR